MNIIISRRIYKAVLTGTIDIKDLPTHDKLADGIQRIHRSKLNFCTITGPCTIGSISPGIISCIICEALYRISVRSARAGGDQNII